MINYQYKNCPIPGGGYVTGFIFNKNKEGILYIRTDIGGSYRYLYEKDKWESITEHVNMSDLRQTFPIALCLDEKSDSTIYIMSGVNCKKENFVNGLFSISKDYGTTYINKDVPFFVHGNLNGRGTGFRLVKNPLEENGFYYASQKDGLWKTNDEGDSWEKLPLAEDYLSALWVSENGKIIIVGSAGLTNKVSDIERGPGLYISFDGGKSFRVEDYISFKNIHGKEIDSESKMSGYVPHRFDFDGQYLYMTINCTGQYNYEVPLGYSCDSGSQKHGKLFRVLIDSSSERLTFEDITPDFEPFYINDSSDIELKSFNDANFGFGGISSCKSYPGLLAVSTITRDAGDCIYISKDFGSTWELALYDLAIGNISFDTPYMSPECNGNRSLIHWLTDIKINPFNADEIWFNTGTGVFRGYNFTKDNRYFKDCTKGIEETVHLNVYSLPEGPVKVLDILGDLGGFAFSDLDTPCFNSFDNANHDRYITCINADYSDYHCNNIIVAARGNWTGKTQGGLIISNDYAKTFNRLDSPYGISDYINDRLTQIETPNVNPGWVSINKDCDSVVWNVAEGIDLFAKGCIHLSLTNENGIFNISKASKVVIYDLNEEDISYSDTHFKVFSDSVDSRVFYGFGDELRLFISIDSGKSFKEIKNEYKHSGSILGLIDCANKTEIRRSAGVKGLFYGAFAENGLLKIQFDADALDVKIEKLSKDNDIVYKMGLGIIGPNESYMGNSKALYIYARINNKYGFYRSVDEGATWDLLNDDQHQFGDINSVSGDAREFGRFFIATGSFGLKYGIPE